MELIERYLLLWKMFSRFQIIRGINKKEVE